MPLVYLDPATQQHAPAASETEQRFPDHLQRTEESARSLLGFTPHDQGSQLLRARKSKSRRVALRGVGAN